MEENSNQANQIPVQPITNPAPAIQNQPTVSPQISDKSAIVALLLIYLNPVGVFLMWKWMKGWKKSIKILITIPLLLALTGFFGGISMGMMGYNSIKKLESAKIKITPSPLVHPPTPTIDPTANSDSIGANWKTYTDSKGLFVFRYPPGSNIKVGEVYNAKSNPKPEWVLTDVEIQRVLQSGEEYPGNIRPFSLSLLVSNNTNNLTTEKQKEDVLKGLCPETLKPYKNGEIDGLYFVGCGKSTLMGLYRQQMIMYITKDKIYQFMLNSLEGEGAELDVKTREYIDQILQTFHFAK